jgi:membrane protein implicated in regulation of membrane protease activity
MDSDSSADNLRFGQGVIIAARWILVAAGLALALVSPAPLGELRLQIVLILGLAVANFWLTAQVLTRRPVLTGIVYALSAADIAVISLLVNAGGGFPSNNYVFYFPAVVAISLAFGLEMTLLFTGTAIGAYSIMALSTGGIEKPEVVLIRMVMLIAVVACGNVYRRVERDNRRRATEEARAALLAQVQPRATSGVGR